MAAKWFNSLDTNSIDCANAAHTTILLDWSISLATASCGLWRVAQQTLLHTFHISFCQHVIESVNVFFDSPCTEFMALKWFILKIWPTFWKIEKMNINYLGHFSIIMAFDSTFDSTFMESDFWFWQNKGCKENWGIFYCNLRWVWLFKLHR